MNEVTEELWQRGLRAGYMPEDLEKGYTIEKDEEKASGATFIKRIEVLEKFNSDEEAAKYAEEHDGVKVIRDITFKKGDPYHAYYIDTKDNREKVINAIEEEAQGSLNIFSDAMHDAKCYLEKLTDALECLKISIPIDKIFLMPKAHILGLITERIKLYREKIALKDKGDIEYEYEVSREKLRFGQTVNSFTGGTYRIIEIYRPNCMLLLNLTNGQFLVADEIGAYYRYPKGQKMNIHNTDFGVKWKHQIFLPGRPSLVDFKRIYEQFGTIPIQNDKGEYEVEIKETLSKIIPVKTDDPDKAIDEVQMQYDREVIVLDSSNFQEVNFRITNRRPVIETQRVV